MRRRCENERWQLHCGNSSKNLTLGWWLEGKVLRLITDVHSLSSPEVSEKMGNNVLQTNHHVTQDMCCGFLSL